MGTTSYKAERDAAIAACKAAQRIINDYFSGEFTVHTKADKTPVTEVDIKCEEAIKQLLTERFPGYGFYGEETGSSGLHQPYYWLVDPIDGTKSFIRNSPYFSTQIALIHQQEFVLGVSNAPGMGELAVAIKGQGATLNGTPASVSATERLEYAYLSTGNIKSLAGCASAWSGYAQLVQRVARTRGYGDYCHYHQLATAQADIVVESDVNILDIAALTVIVREAGGVITDLQGEAISLDTTSVLAACNSALHAETLNLLSYKSIH